MRGEAGVVIQDGKITGLDTSGARLRRGQRLSTSDRMRACCPGSSMLTCILPSMPRPTWSVAGGVRRRRPVGSDRGCRGPGPAGGGDHGPRPGRPELPVAEAQPALPVSDAPAHRRGGPADHDPRGALLLPGRRGRGRGRSAGSGARARRPGLRRCQGHGERGQPHPGSQPHESQYDLAALRVVVDEAHRAGLRRRARPRGPAVADAVEAGFDTLEHVTFFTADGVDADPALLDRIAASGVVVSVTVGNIPDGSSPHLPLHSVWLPSSPTTAGCSGPGPRWSPVRTLAYRPASRMTSCPTRCGHWSSGSG